MGADTSRVKFCYYVDYLNSVVINEKKFHLARKLVALYFKRVINIMTKYLVTGVAGFVGAAIARRLLKEGG